MHIFNALAFFYGLKLDLYVSVCVCAFEEGGGEVRIRYTLSTVNQTEICRYIPTELKIIFTRFVCAYVHMCLYMCVCVCLCVYEDPQHPLCSSICTHLIFTTCLYLNIKSFSLLSLGWIFKYKYVRDVGDYMIWGMCVLYGQGSIAPYFLYTSNPLISITCSHLNNYSFSVMSLI